jgi:hypothetical protein
MLLIYELSVNTKEIDQKNEIKIVIKNPEKKYIFVKKLLFSISTDQPAINIIADNALSVQINDRNWQISAHKLEFEVMPKSGEPEDIIGKELVIVIHINSNHELGEKKLNIYEEAQLSIFDKYVPQITFHKSSLLAPISKAQQIIKSEESVKIDNLYCEGIEQIGNMICQNYLIHYSTELADSVKICDHKQNKIIDVPLKGIYKVPAYPVDTAKYTITAYNANCNITISEEFEIIGELAATLGSSNNNIFKDKLFSQDKLGVNKFSLIRNLYPQMIFLWAIFSFMIITYRV